MTALLALAACTPDPTQPVADGATSAPTHASTTEPTVESTDPNVDSRCTVSPGTVACSHETTAVTTGWPVYDPREVHWQVPIGDAPPEGWPAVILFQGSFFSAELTWSGSDGDPIGLYPQALLVKALLDGGHAVITPEAQLDGSTYWDTDIPPWSFAWDTSPDAAFVAVILDDITSGAFGPIDTDRLYAGGISSGGYMTSRMAVSYPGVFRALAIESASYATCDGWICVVPALPADHPPTLFLHGEQDAIVPIATMIPYADALAAQGTPVDEVIDPDAGHEWLSVAPDEVPAFFDGH